MEEQEKPLSCEARGGGEVEFGAIELIFKWL
jgi:hypothetical protein